MHHLSTLAERVSLHLKFGLLVWTASRQSFLSEMEWSMRLSPTVEEFLRERRFAVLATINDDGSPQQTVMWYELRDGAVMLNTRSGRVKDRNLQRDGRASLCVEEEQKYVAISGIMKVDEDPERGQETIVALATRYDGLEEAKESSESTFRHQHRVTLTLSIDRVDAHGFDG